MRINREKLSRFLQSRPDVVFAVVFGSAKEGEAGDESNLDLGVYFDPAPGLDALLDFMAEASGACDFDRVDLTDLRKADPILAFEAISGRFLCKNDPQRTAEYVSLACREYEDEMWRIRHAA